MLLCECLGKTPVSNRLQMLARHNPQAYLRYPVLTHSTPGSACFWSIASGCKHYDAIHGKQVCGSSFPRFGDSVDRTYSRYSTAASVASRGRARLLEPAT